MFRRNAPQYDKLILVESPTKVFSYNSYMKQLQMKLGHLHFNRADLKKMDGGSKEVIVVKPTVGHMHTMSDLEMPLSGDSRIFNAKWVVQDDRKKTAAEIKEALRKMNKKQTEIIIATDPDREGELIGANVFDMLPGGYKYSRMYVNAITPQGIEEGLKERQVNFIDRDLCAAAETRHSMDRIFGFLGSRFVNHWYKNLRSVGRVQTPTLILLSQREAAIKKAEENELVTFYSEVVLQMDKKLGLDKPKTCRLKFGGNNDDADGKAKGEIIFEDKAECEKKLASLKLTPLTPASAFKLAGKARKNAESVKKAPEPLHMQTLILEAGKKLGIGSDDVAKAAQSLFNLGVITYPRTDSVRIMDEAVDGKIIPYIISEYGKRMVRSASDEKKAKKKEEKKKKPKKGEEEKKLKEGNVEDAHEAIHPTNFAFVPGSDKLKKQLSTAKYPTKHDAGLYEIIFNGTIAAFMIPCRTETVSVPFCVGADAATFNISATKTVELGWRRVVKDSVVQQENKDADAMKQKTDGTANEEDALEEETSADSAVDEEALFNVLAKVNESGSVPKDLFVLTDAVMKERTSKPPPNFTEGTLIQELKRNGVGRPSTYPSIVKTLKDRGYAKTKGTKILITPLGQELVNLAGDCFPKIVDIKFTEKFEKSLDVIARGKDKETTTNSTVLNSFFNDFGGMITGSAKMLSTSGKSVPEFPTAVKGCRTLQEVCQTGGWYFNNNIPGNGGAAFATGQKKAPKREQPAAEEAATASSEDDDSVEPPFVVQSKKQGSSTDSGDKPPTVDI